MLQTHGSQFMTDATSVATDTTSVAIRHIQRRFRSRMAAMAKMRKPAAQFMTQTYVQQSCLHHAVELCAPRACLAHHLSPTLQKCRLSPARPPERDVSARLLRLVRTFLVQVRSCRGVGAAAVSALTLSPCYLCSFRTAGATCGNGFNGGAAMWLYTCDGFSSVAKCSRCNHRCAPAAAGAPDVCDPPGGRTQPAFDIDETESTSGSQLGGYGTVKSFDLSYNNL